MRRTSIGFFVVLAALTPVSAQTVNQDKLCAQLKECLGKLLGKAIESPDSSLTEEQFCDMLVEVYQGEAGVQNICAVSRSGMVRASNSGQQSSEKENESTKVNVENNSEPKRKKKKGNKKTSTQPNTSSNTEANSKATHSETTKTIVEADYKHPAQM